mmetsp:Transcript_41486/g.103662  ORF Transcript_41486/g.103662 Transcript_41486/m.103662 type:complete len:245 (-) Transcript_41486:97-831(-)
MGLTSLSFTFATLAPRDLIGPIAASLTRAATSDPEKPCVISAATLRSLSEIDVFCPFKRCFISCFLVSCSGSGIIIRFVNRLLTASSSSWGRLVAATTMTRDSWEVLTPSNCTRNSVLSLLDASCSDSDLALSTESTSSMNTIEGSRCRATAKSALTSFSACPTHLEVRAEAEMLKNRQLHSVASALASRVLPVPGGPNSRTPLGGDLRPVKRSGRRAGRITASLNASLASESPAMSSNLTPGV